MAPPFALFLLLALVQRTLCHVTVTSSRDSGFSPPPGSLPSSLEPSQLAAASPPSVGLARLPTGEPAQRSSGADVLQQGADEELDVHQESRSTEEDLGSRKRHPDGASSAGPERKLAYGAGPDRDNLDGPPAFKQKQIQEVTGVTVATHKGTLVETHVSPLPSGHLDSRHRWSVALSTPASPVLTPKSPNSGTNQVRTSSASNASPRATKAPKHKQDNSAMVQVLTVNPFHSPDQSYRPKLTVAAVVGEEQMGTGKVLGQPEYNAGVDDWLIAGSGDLPSAIGREESSSASPSVKSDTLANVQPEARATAGFTSVTEAPTSSTVIQVPQLRPTTVSLANPKSRTGSADPQTTTSISRETRKPLIVSKVGLEKAKLVMQTPTSVTLPDRKSTTLMSATNQSTKTVVTELTTRTSSTPLSPTGQGSDPKAGRMLEKNVSILLGHAPTLLSSPTPSPSPLDPCVSGRGPCLSPTPHNGTLLLWADLQRKLSFAWELHVYGTAVLFLLLAAGALVGLFLSPGLYCPHRGCLALANALLLLAGTLRAVLFFLDPYGTSEVLPRTGVTALYNLPLPPLIWAQASLVLLTLRAAGQMGLLPLGLQRPPLAAVLAVVHCTVLLAADLLSAALSPAVPAVLQLLSLSWGLLLCLGSLFYAFPQLLRPPAPPLDEPVARAGWQPEGLWSLRILGRVMVVCTCLGALCCGLHAYATFWLYGWLGHWRSFSWAWWLVQFWARLLELAWSAFMLLLASWVFWRPRDRDACPANVAAGVEAPSSSCSSSSTQRHPCWAKIVQSLRGRPCRKSDSGGAGEVPNNWAGQERPGADISKSLIRNRDQAPGSRSVKDSNRGRNQKGGTGDGSTGSLLRLQSLGRTPRRSLSSSLEREKDWVQEKESILSLTDFDLRPPSPIDLSRSIDEALHREHLLRGEGFFRGLSPPSATSPGPHRHALTSWPRRSSDPQVNLSQSCSREEQSADGGGATERQAAAPSTPTLQSCTSEQDKDAIQRVPTSASCPVSFRPHRGPGRLRGSGGDDTKPFVTPDSEPEGGPAGMSQGASRGLLEVSRQDDSASMSSEIIDL
ncbi:proline-rich transmembrane protein 3 [Brienomyrus brachyistius]|uniref:proline-rich transmembrane protein 3 n=1 Tax=Brienomyrus brachyistius TaxID=42636 RepID=UPI0020B41E67|nr:proline-rich transmembrane protein 3 [Brienomyrus brachyistius]